MSSDIKPGDLVMIVRPRPCCGAVSRMGLVSIAKAPRSGARGVECQDCGFFDSDLSNYYFLEKGLAHISRLKKIDPPALDESVERVRELENA